MLQLTMLIKFMFGCAAAIAAEPMSPAEIRATFFNGQPFTAISPSGAKFKMTFTPDGKMTREPLEQSGKASAGTWKLSAKGFCTAWDHAKANCFTIIPTGENKWSVQKNRNYHRNHGCNLVEIAFASVAMAGDLEKQHDERQNSIKERLHGRIA